MMGCTKQMMRRKKVRLHGGGCFEMGGGDGNKKRRLLIVVNVLGSAGPLRFVVNEDDRVGNVIDTALKLYAKEGRLPLLGSHATDFFLYSPHSGFNAMSQWEAIGTSGARNFVLCKKPKQQQPNMTEARSDLMSRKKHHNWKTWLTKSLSFKISSHHYKKISI